MIARGGPWLLIACFCLAAAACGTSTANEPSSSPAIAGASEAPASSAPSPSPTLAPGQLEVLALDALSQGAADSARVLENSIGVAVYVPSERRIYQYNAEPQFPIASAVKVPIMLAVMDRAIEEGRVISDFEEDLIQAMITESDNDAATELWNLLGGAPGVQDYLESIGFGTDAVTIDVDDWGDSQMSAAAAARMMAKLVNGEILDATHREYAMALLTRIDPAQDWGAVVAGSSDGLAGVKNGWYPEYEGWVLASLGYVVPDGDAPAYTIAIFTKGWLRFSGGVNRIENIGILVHTELSGE